jgi:hypothetical protein
VASVRESSTSDQKTAGLAKQYSSVKLAVDYGKEERVPEIEL